MACSLDVIRAKLRKVLRWSLSRFHRESTLRFIPKDVKSPSGF